MLDQKFTSKQMKYHLCSYFMYERNMLGAFTESFNEADVIALTPRMYITEVEIKVSRADLRRELSIIHAVLANDSTRKISSSVKWWKHVCYLREKHLKVMPKYYYIAVPLELIEIATKGVEGTPYGVLTLTRYESSGYSDEPQVRVDIQCVIQAKQIANKKIEEKSVLQLVRKACNENVALRGKLCFI